MAQPDILVFGDPSPAPRRPWLGPTLIIVVLLVLAGFGVAGHDGRPAPSPSPAPAVSLPVVAPPAVAIRRWGYDSGNAAVTTFTVEVTNSAARPFVLSRPRVQAVTGITIVGIGLAVGNGVTDLANPDTPLSPTLTLPSGGVGWFVVWLRIGCQPVPAWPYLKHFVVSISNGTDTVDEPVDPPVASGDPHPTPLCH